MRNVRYDSDGQPLDLSYNLISNKKKAVLCLRGILEGITADKVLNENEVLFLDLWLKNTSVLSDNGDVVDLFDILNRVLLKKEIASNDLYDLNSIILDIIEYGEHSDDTIESKINELLGLLSGIVADNIVNEKEFFLLDDWLKSNRCIGNSWPANIIIEKIKDIKSDEIIDKDELMEFLELLKQISGVRFIETGLAHGLVSEVFSDDIESFSHQDKKICFSGKFITGFRKTVEKCAQDKGALIQNKVTKDLNALIIGTFTSKDWKFTSFGRKIETVLDLNKTGSHILILSERKWLSFL